MHRKIKPISLMALTTSIGFGSLAISEIESIRQFAILTSLLIVIVSIGIVGWHGLMFPILKKVISRASVLTFLSWNMLHQQSKYIVYGSIVLLLLAGGLLAPGIRILTGATEYFPSESVEKKNIDYITKNVLGNPNYEVIVSRKDGEDLDYSDYQSMAKLEQQIGEYFSSSKILSINQFVTELNYLYSGNHRIPNIGIAYYTLLGQLPLDQKATYLYEGSYRITLLGPNVNHQQFSSDSNYFKDLIANNLSYNISLSGVQYSMLKSQEFLIGTLIKSFLLSFFIICLIFAIVFKQIRAILPFAIANIVPLVSSFIFIRLMNYSLNIATIMTFSISLGLIVDSTIHVIHDKINNIPKKDHLRSTLMPIIVGQLILVLSFAMFTINDFLPIREMGGILSFTLLMALVFDLYHLPAIIRD